MPHAWPIRLAALLALGFLLFGAYAQDDAQEDGTSQRMQQGSELYTIRCSACHGMEGQGAGPIPQLAGNPFVTIQQPGPMLQTILTGRGGMPRFNYMLSNEQLAAIATYIRNAWENDAADVSPETVAEARQQLQGMQEAAGGGQAKDEGDGDDDGNAGGQTDGGGEEQREDAQ